MLAGSFDCGGARDMLVIYLDVKLILDDAGDLSGGNRAKAHYRSYLTRSGTGYYAHSYL